MDTLFLANRLRVPPRTQVAVGRPSLLEVLTSATLQHKLTVLSAPAGYGKTTLLVQWAHESQCPVAWMSVEQEDNDLDRFLRCLMAAWEESAPGVRESPLDLMFRTKELDTNVVLASFLDLTGKMPYHTIFVLDDYHHINVPAIHSAIVFLLDHLPANAHFVLAGRGEPPLPLSRYRARQELLELGTADLRFSAEETTVFLNGTLDTPLSPEDIAALHDQLEGWVAGLQLAALSLSRRRPTELAGKLILSGRHRYIADYLAEDVLARLPERSRWFLLQTSILDLLSGDLCNAVTGQNDGQDTLETLERQGLFIQPLDDSREWFRYHRLFADFLQAELRRRFPDDINSFHRRAARWYLDQDLSEPAFSHALDGNDVDLVGYILEHYMNAKLLSGEVGVVKRWVEPLPGEWFVHHPELGLARAGALYFTGEVDALIRCIDDVEQRLALDNREGVRGHLARVTGIRCFIACYNNDMARAEDLANQALRDLPVSDLGFRPGIFAALGDTYRQNGRWEDARTCYRKALTYTDSPAVKVESVHLFGALADLDLMQGRLGDAASYWRKAVVIIQDHSCWGGYDLPVIGWVDIRLGEILYEWNELSDAADHLSRGLQRAELGGDVRALIAGHILASRMKLTEGDSDSGAEHLEQVRQLLEQATFPDWISHFERGLVELWLAQGRIEHAANWANLMLQGDSLERRPENEIARLTIARALIAQGQASATERARSLLEQLLQEATSEGRGGIVIEALAQLAMVHWMREEQAGALSTLERALRLAEPEGYVRLFADLGPMMGRLLQEARSRAVMPAYVDRLIGAFGANRVSPHSVSGSKIWVLPEPLTIREQDVLRLLAAGLTNREIGETLVISPETVKKHTTSIYGKLSVSNRTEAASRGRQLGLLGE